MLDLFWKQNQRKHAIKRLNQRYGLTEGDYDTIRNRLLNGTYLQAFYKTKNRMEIHMKYKKRVVRMIVDYKSNEIVTFLPELARNVKLVRYEKKED